MQLTSICDEHLAANTEARVPIATDESAWAGVGLH